MSVFINFVLLAAKSSQMVQVLPVRCRRSNKLKRKTRPCRKNSKVSASRLRRPRRACGSWPHSTRCSPHKSCTSQSRRDSYTSRCALRCFLTLLVWGTFPFATVWLQMQAVAATEFVSMGNVQLGKAIRLNSSTRKLLFCFFLVASLLLLLFDWWFS